MNKTQALEKFYSSFGLPAYEENTIPKEAKMPYITYEVITGSLSDFNLSLSCQIWYKSNSWKEINAKAEEISKELAGGKKLMVDDGAIMLYRGQPFAQNTPNGDDSTVKCKYINISADYITL